MLTDSTRPTMGVRYYEGETSLCTNSLTILFLLSLAGEVGMTSNEDMAFMEERKGKQRPKSYDHLLIQGVRKRLLGLAVLASEK